MKLDKPQLIISMDTELLWGSTTIDKLNFLKSKGDLRKNTIYRLLRLFKKYKIPVTWAIVGHLFLEKCDKSSCLVWRNIEEHNYRRDWYIDPFSSIKEDPSYYGSDIVESILNDPIDHEIGYHSFSHPRFNEISREMAEDELKEAKKIEKEWGIKLKSFVFPRDEIAHVDLLKQNGFEIYRGVKTRKYNPKQILPVRKLQGGIDKVIAPPVEPRWVDSIWAIPSSMFFCDPQLKFSVLPRAKIGLNRAINSNKVFHVFLHPWNLLLYNRLKDDLDEFLSYVSKKRDKGEVDVMTMGELADKLNYKDCLKHDSA